MRLTSLSSRASMVTGGDVLVALENDGADRGQPRMLLDGYEYLSNESPDAGHVVEVDGLRVMSISGVKEHSSLRLTYGDDPDAGATLVLENHPTTGPLFAGPPLSPFVCANQKFQLSAPQDADCSAPTTYVWWYVNTAGTVAPLPRAASLPGDVAMTTVNGQAVPFILRQETGVLDRSIYEITVVDPRPDAAFGSAPPPPMPWGTSQPTPVWRHAGWNGRLLYRYGGGCNTTYANGQLSVNVLDLDVLGRGYAIATSTLNTFQNLCNDVVSAEVTAMVKERFIERYGVPVHTISDGGSGGAIQQIQIAQNYPGLLDGIAPTLPFADTISIAAGLTDCGLLNRYRNTPTGLQLTEDQWAAIMGVLSTKTCFNWQSGFLDVVDPKVGCDASLAAQVYDPVTRPKGVRCTLQESNVNLFGRDPATGFARRPIDNVGVTYGLAALTAGTITVDQFLDINEGIGGYDLDGRITPARSSADEATIAAAYRSGQVTEAGPVQDIPIILRNIYNDAKGDIHDRFRAFSIRDRLPGADGGTDPNLVIWTIASPLDLHDSLVSADAQGAEPVYVLDDWLTKAEALSAGGTRRPTRQELAQSRPVEAFDSCKIDGQWTRGDQVYAAGPCHDEFPIHADPRITAGEARRDDILKCATRPVDDAWFAASGVAFSAAQRARMATIFAAGVCDWTRTGVGQVPTAGPWQRYR